MRKARCTRRGSTTVSKASSKIAPTSAIPSMTASSCIRREMLMSREWYQIQPGEADDMSVAEAIAPGPASVFLRRGVGRLQRLPDREQFLQDAPQLRRLQRVRSVGLRLSRVL